MLAFIFEEQRSQKSPAASVSGAVAPDVLPQVVEPVDLVVIREESHIALDNDFNKARVKMWRAAHGAVMELKRIPVCARECIPTVSGSISRHGSLHRQTAVSQSSPFAHILSPFSLFDHSLSLRRGSCQSWLERM